jgi:hypothetical protein
MIAGAKPRKKAIIHEKGKKPRAENRELKTFYYLSRLIDLRKLR